MIMTGEPVDRASSARSRLRQTLLHDLLGFARSHHDRVAAAVAALGLTPTQAKAIYHLATATSMRKLAARLHCDASNVTGVVNRLEQLGLLERHADPTDRRVKRLRLTRAGRELRAAVATVMFQAPELDRLVEAEEQTLAQLMGKIWHESDASMD